MTCRRIVRRIWHVNFIDPRSSTVWCRLDSSNLNLTILSCDAHSPCPWLLPAILLCTVMKGVGEKRHSELSSEPNGLWRTYHARGRQDARKTLCWRANGSTTESLRLSSPSPPPLPLVSQGRIGRQVEWYNIITNKLSLRLSTEYKENLHWLVMIIRTTINELNQAISYKLLRMIRRFMLLQ